MTELPTGTVTFLFTDIEWSTRLVKDLRADYQGVLEAHQRILRDTFREFGGTAFDTQGDSCFFVFRRALDAVAAAAAAQRALAEHEWPHGGRVRVRMGLHTAEPVPAGERYVGLGVHRAARISASGHGGQVVLSNTTRELVEDDLPHDVTLRDLGECRLKDIDRPERIFQLELEGLPTDFPPLRTLDPATPLAEREAELEAAAGAAISRRFPPSRRSFMLAAVAGSIAVAAVAAIYTLTGDSKPEARLVGAWASVDRDGSNQTLEVTRRPEAGSYDLTLKDDDAQAACGGGPVTGNGVGTASGDRLSTNVRLTCASGSTLEFPFTLTYRAADDTLVDIKEGSSGHGPEGTAKLRAIEDRRPSSLEPDSPPA